MFVIVSRRRGSGNIGQIYALLAARRLELTCARKSCGKFRAEMIATEIELLAAKMQAIGNALIFGGRRYVRRLAKRLGN